MAQLEFHSAAVLCWMGDRLGTPGAAGSGLGLNAAYRRLKNIDPSSPLVVIKPPCLSQVECLRKNRWGSKEPSMTSKSDK